MDGLLIVDKPVGPTSHDVVDAARRTLGEKRIGHTGTLDPAASGVLPLVVGRATRLAKFLSAGDKSYEAVVRCGIATDTGDASGVPIGRAGHDAAPPRGTVDAALDAFRGTWLQQPPAFSAKKIGGRRSYRIARERRDRPQEPQPGPPSLPAPARVTVQRLEVVEVSGARITISLDCSSGFYVRALAQELGERLGTLAHLEELRRTRCAGLSIADALPFEVVRHDREATRAAIIPLARLLPNLTAVVLTDEGVRRVAHGRDIGPGDVVGGTGTDAGTWPGGVPVGAAIRLIDQRGDLVGIGEPGGASGELVILHPSIVLR